VIGILFVLFTILAVIGVTAFFLYGHPLVLVNPYPDYILDLDDGLTTKTTPDRIVA
jgi:hypothetical protein